MRVVRPSNRTNQSWTHARLQSLYVGIGLGMARGQCRALIVQLIGVVMNALQSPYVHDSRRASRQLLAGCHRRTKAAATVACGLCMFVCEKSASQLARLGLEAIRCCWGARRVLSSGRLAGVLPDLRSVQLPHGAWDLHLPSPCQM
jgi:hypothetical protein